MSSSSEQFDDRANISFVDYVDSLRIPYEEIKLATNNFTDANLLPIQSPSSSSFQKLIYKGQLEQSGGQLIDIVVRIIPEPQDNIVFNELVTSYLLTHQNILPIFKISGTDDPIIINKYEANESLDKHLCDSNLTWIQRLHICMGVAHALSYIHDFDAEGDFSVIHGNIKSSKILLDENWEPKLNCFGFSMFVKKHQPHLTSKYSGTLQYTDPAYANTGCLTQKSDVFSFGVVLFEVLFGEIASVKDQDNWYFAGFARSIYEKKTLDDMINIDLHKQMDPQSLHIFSETAYYCLEKESSRRPNMVQIVKKLEASLELQQNHESLMNFKGNIDDAPMKVNIVVDDASTAPESEIMSSPKDDLAHLRLPLEEIISATNNFTDENVICTYAFANEYNGQLLWSDELINIAAMRFDEESNNRGEQQFWMEISLLSSLKHKNLVSLVGFCDENDEKIVIKRREMRGRLDNYLSDPTLTWVLRLEICVGLARALSYIHYDEPRDFSVIHMNIMSATVVLSDDWEPKLSDFELSLKIKASERHHTFFTDKVWSMKGYTDPIYIATKSVNHKSDIYSLGIVLFELLCGRKAVINDDQDNKYLASVAVTHYREKKLNEIIDWNLWNQMDSQSFNIFAEIAYDCLNEERSQRPNIDAIVTRLEKALELQLEHHYAERSIAAAELEGASSNHEKGSMTIISKGVESHVSKKTISSLKGSLEDYLGSSDKRNNLTWTRRLKICLDIAHGLNYIHTKMDQNKQVIIHYDIKSSNILLDANWEAKISDFGLSKLNTADQEASTLNINRSAGTHKYKYLEYGRLNKEYLEYGRLNKESDIYSFGIVLFEVLTGRLAYDRIFTDVDEKGIAPIARHQFEKGRLIEIVDHKIKEETDHIFSLSKGLNKESLDIFSRIAYRCLAETQVDRPSIDVVINELRKALKFQQESLKLSLKDIKLATQNFSQENLIGLGVLGKVYKGVSTHTHGHYIIAAKRLDRKFGQGESEFMTEQRMLLEYNHENVIGLVGYCNEGDEKVIVYEYASRGSLDRYLSDASLTWVMRLKICIDIAIGLEFLHGTISSPEMVIHRDINSSNILLFDDWKAKITGFGLSLICPTQNVDYVMDNVTGTIGYRDPLYSKTGFLTKESDIFSLGAVLFDILCGKLSSEKLDDECLYLPFLAQQHYHLGKLDELVFEGIKKQIEPESFITFARIAYRCLHHRRERRPTADEVVIQLKKALELQEDVDIWEPKLPKDYKEIIQMSKCPEIYSIKKKEDLYNIFSKGILLQQDKVLFSVNVNGEGNKMVSATKFSYINSCRHEWKSLPESRFSTVVEMLDISNLNIVIKADAQLLSPNVAYGVYLVFKFCDSRRISSKPMCVNLTYRKGLESLHAYFATWRDDEWLMIELYRFLNHNEDVVFEILLESFSSYYCGESAVYVEGIEFRAIDKVKHDEIGKLNEVKQVLKLNYNVDQVQQIPINFEEIFKICRNYDELFWLGEVDKKKLLVLSAKAALYKFSNVDRFTSKPSTQSRFQEVIELFPQQVFYINCTIKSQMLSQDTGYLCCLVFKLSEKYQGLHCPVKVRDVLRQENNEAEFVYFITPSPLNINCITRVPKQREDGWMEIQLWKFNSTQEFKEDTLSVEIKFTSYEGAMSGLIVCGLEFRPM